MPEEPTEKSPSWLADADKQHRTHAPNYLRLYANNFRLQLGTWDASITFGESVGEKEGQIVVEETAKITMSLPHLKALTQVMNMHIALFEKRFGEIRIPDLADIPKDAEPIKLQAVPSPEKPAPKE